MAHDMPGWFGRIPFNRKVKETPPKTSTCCEKFKRLWKKITCQKSSKYGEFDEEIRKRKLQLNIQGVQPVVVVFSGCFLLKIFNSWHFMDFLIRSSYVEIDESDFSLGMPQKTRKHIQNLLNQGDQVKFLVLDYSGRALERVVCKSDQMKETQSPLMLKSTESPCERDSLTKKNKIIVELTKDGKRKTEETMVISPLFSPELEKNKK